MSKPSNPLNGHGFTKPGFTNDVAWSILPELEGQAETKVKGQDPRKKTCKIIFAVAGLLVILLVLVSLPILLRPKQEGVVHYGHKENDFHPVQLSGFVIVEGMKWSHDLSNHGSYLYKKTVTDLQYSMDEMLRASDFREVYTRTDIKDLSSRSGGVMCEYRVTLQDLSRQDLGLKSMVVRDRLMEDAQKELGSNLVQGLENLRQDGKNQERLHTFNIESLLTIVVQPYYVSSSSSLSLPINTDTDTHYKHTDKAILTRSQNKIPNLLSLNKKRGSPFLASMSKVHEAGLDMAKTQNQNQRVSSFNRKVKRHVNWSKPSVTREVTNDQKSLRNDNPPCLSPSCLSSSPIKPYPSEPRQRTENPETSKDKNLKSTENMGQKNDTGIGQKQTSGWGENMGSEKREGSIWVKNSDPAWIGNKTWGFGETERSSSNSSWAEKKPWGFDQTQSVKPSSNMTSVNQSLKWVPEPHRGWVSNKTWGFDSADMSDKLKNSSWIQKKTWGFSQGEQNGARNSTQARGGNASLSSAMVVKPYSQWVQNRTWGFGSMDESSRTNSSWLQNKTWGFESSNAKAENGEGGQTDNWGSKPTGSRPTDGSQMTAKSDKNSAPQPFPEWTQNKTWGFDQKTDEKSNSSWLPGRKWGFI